MEHNKPLNDAGTETKMLEEKVEDKIEEIRAALKHSKALLLQGNTGCGKTTRVPRYLLENYKRIVCTQPRRIAAVSVSTKIAQDMGVELGTAVGYSVRFQDLCNESTRLLFVTDGIFLKKFRKFLEYDLIIIDEVHERSLNIDIVIGLLKMQYRGDILLMSATINAEKIQEYFGCPMIEIRHVSHPREVYYLKDDAKDGQIDDSHAAKASTGNDPDAGNDSNASINAKSHKARSKVDYIKDAVETVIRITIEEPRGDILVFLTGKEEIDKMKKTLESFAKGIQILRLCSSISLEEQQMVFSKRGRAIILATNIAETSITLSNVDFVVDCGRSKVMACNTTMMSSALRTAMISKAEANQRAGRTGRTGPGKVYRLYSHAEYQEMEDFPTPAIKRSKLDSVVLMMKNWGIDNVISFPYIDPPYQNSLASSIRFLYYLKAIDSAGRITQLGRDLARMPLDPSLAMTIHTARKLDCLDSVTTIVAFLEYGNTICEDGRPPSPSPGGDFYTYLDLYQRWKDADFSVKYLAKNKLIVSAFHQILQIKLQLMELNSHGCIQRLKKVASKHYRPHPPGSIEKAFCSGFIMNIAKKGEKSYQTIFNDVSCFIPSADPLFRSSAKYVLYYELFESHKRYMRHCIEIPSYVFPEIVNLNYLGKS